MEEGGSWQERLLIFVLLCAMVSYLAKVVFAFRASNMALRRPGEDENESEGSEGTDESLHSD